MLNEGTRICRDCGKDFVVSKFHPYIVQCKKCRKKNGTQIIKHVKAKKVKCCDYIFNLEKHGLHKCRVCEKQWWHIINGYFREYQSKRIYYKGQFLGEAVELGDIRRIINGHSKGNQESYSVQE